MGKKTIPETRALNQKALAAIILERYKEFIADLKREENFLQQIIIGEKERTRMERIRALINKR